jgi:hypothetical protein
MIDHSSGSLYWLSLIVPGKAGGLIITFFYGPSKGMTRTGTDDLCSRSLLVLPRRRDIATLFPCDPAIIMSIDNLFA